MSSHDSGGPLTRGTNAILAVHRAGLGVPAPVGMGRWRLAATEFRTKMDFYGYPFNGRNSNVQLTGL